MLLSSESNLHAERKQMHKFKKVESGDREKKVRVTDHTSCQNNKLHEAVKVTYMLIITNCTSSQRSQVEKENNQVHVTDHTSCQNTQCCEVVKLTYRLSTRERKSSQKYKVEKENNKVHVIVLTSFRMFNNMKQ